MCLKFCLVSMSAHGISIYTVPSPYPGLAPRHSPVNHRTMAPAPTMANLGIAYFRQDANKCFVQREF